MYNSCLILSSFLWFLLTELDLNKGSDDHFIQEYIANPLLIDKRKFDIGLYTVLTSIDPLRVYVYDQEVLIRYDLFQPFSGADPGFFLGGGVLVSCSISTPINQNAEYQLY